MQYQRQPAIVDPLQVARIFGHRMQEVFITSARAKITEFYTDEEAEVTKLARHWKTVKQHAKTLLDPLLFSTETCPICTEQFSPVDSYYLWPQIAPKCPLAPGSSACGSPTLALEAYALLLEDDVGELVWFLAGLGLAQVNTSTVESLRLHLQERQYERTPHICYLTEVLLPKLLNLANGNKVEGSPFPAETSLALELAADQSLPLEQASAVEEGLLPKALRKAWCCRSLQAQRGVRSEPTGLCNDPLPWFEVHLDGKWATGSIVSAMFLIFGTWRLLRRSSYCSGWRERD